MVPGLVNQHSQLDNHDFSMGKFTLNGPKFAIFNSVLYVFPAGYVLSDVEEIALKTEELAKNAREAQGVAAVTGRKKPVALGAFVTVAQLSHEQNTLGN